MNKVLSWFLVLTRLALATPAEDRLTRLFQELKAVRGDSKKHFLLHPEYFDPKLFAAMQDSRDLGIDFLRGTQGRLTKVISLAEQPGGRQVKVTAYVESPRSGNVDIRFNLSPSGKIENILYPWGTNLLDQCKQFKRARK